MKPPRNIKKFSSYEEAIESAREKELEEYLEDEEVEEYDEMDKFDEWYDEQQDNLAKGE